MKKHHLNVDYSLLDKPKKAGKKHGAITRCEKLRDHATAQQALIFAKKMVKKVKVILKDHNGNETILMR